MWTISLFTAQLMQKHRSTAFLPQRIRVSGFAVSSWEIGGAVSNGKTHRIHFGHPRHPLPVDSHGKKGASTGDGRLPDDAQPHLRPLPIELGRGCRGPGIAHRSNTELTRAHLSPAVSHSGSSSRGGNGSGAVLLTHSSDQRGTPRTGVVADRVGEQEWSLCSSLTVGSLGADLWRRQRYGGHHLSPWCFAHRVDGTMVFHFSSNWKELKTHVTLQQIE